MSEKNKHTVAGNRFQSFVIVSLCLSIKIGAAPRDATVSTKKRQLCLREI